MNRKCKKTLLYTGISLAVLIIVVFIFINSIVKNTVKNIVPSIIGVKYVEMEDIDIRPLFGKVSLKQLKVGPPEGFQGDVFTMDEFFVDIDMSTIFSNVMIIDNISISGATASYELSGINSNISAIMKKLESGNNKKEEEKKQKEGKKVIIKNFVFADSNVKLSSSLLGGKGVPLPLPKIELSNIGEKSGGATGIEATIEIFKSIAKGILDAVKSIGTGAVNIIGSGVSSITGIFSSEESSSTTTEQTK